MSELINSVLDWDDPIQDDGKRRTILLPEGDYRFKITKFERGEYPGGNKMPPCKKATLTMEVNAPEGTAEVKTDLFLCSSMQWKLAAFFRSIGLMKSGDTFAMDWTKVPGAEGAAHFKIRDYEFKGKTRQKNDVAYFIDANPALSSDETDDDF